MQIEKDFGKDIIGKITKNTGVLILGNVFTAFLSLFVSILLARYLGKEELGRYSVVYAYISLFGFLTTFGMQNILVREISRDESQADRLLGSALTLSTTLSSAAILSSWIILYFLNYPFNLRLLIYIASFSMLFAPWYFYTSILQVRLQQRYQVLIDVFSKLLLAFLSILFIFLKAALIYFIILNLLMAIITAVGYRHFSIKFIKPNLRVDLKTWLYFLRESWPLALTAVFIGIFLRIDQVMLFRMKGQEALGLYSAAVRLTEAFNIIPLAFMSSVFPMLSQGFLKEGNSFKHIYTLSFRYLTLFIVPVAMVINLLSKQIISLIYGNNFIPSAPVLSLLIWSELFVFTGIVHNQILVSVGKQRLDLLFTLSSAITNVILNFILIPAYGIRGSAIATLISYGIFWPISYALSTTRSYAACMISSIIKPLIASVIAAFLLRNLFFKSIYLSIPLFVLTYLIILFFLGGINRQDLRLLLKLRQDCA